MLNLLLVRAAKGVAQGQPVMQYALIPANH